MTETRMNGSPKDQPKRSGRTGNQNAMRHGLRAGQLPPGCKYIELRMNKFRRELETAVLQAKGEVTLTDCALIQSCLRWERHACLAQRWLTKQGDKLKPLEILQFSKEIALGSSQRDKSLQLLGLNRSVIKDAWAQVDALPEGRE